MKLQTTYVQRQQLQILLEDIYILKQMTLVNFLTTKRQSLRLSKYQMRENLPGGLKNKQFGLHCSNISEVSFQQLLVKLIFKRTCILSKVFPFKLVNWGHGRQNWWFGYSTTFYRILRKEGLPGTLLNQRDTKKRIFLLKQYKIQYFNMGVAGKTTGFWSFCCMPFSVILFLR